jgi:hypothetical protein
MATTDLLKTLCYNDRNELKNRLECRAAMINHLILEEMVDVDEAEDVTDKTLRELNLWPTEDKGKPTPAT